MNKPCEKTWVHVTSGQGPDECALAVHELVLRIVQEAAKAGVVADILDSVDGRKQGTYSSALLCLSGNGAKAFTKPWVGTIQWICQSPYRPHHKRKNWFIGANILEPLADEKIELKDGDITWKTARTSGPGGQHVNTTDSAVQATHHPSGVQVTASAMRSQHANKQLALEKLFAILLSRKRERAAKQAQEKWKKHYELERGNPVKIFVGMAFKEQ